MPTATATHHVRSLDFAVHGDHTRAYRYGRYFWGIGLPDGREAMINADRVDVVSSGALVAWQDSQLVPDTAEYEPLENPLPTMILAPGAWTHVYAASVVDGAPVCVDHLAAPPSGME